MSILYSVYTAYNPVRVVEYEDRVDGPVVGVSVLLLIRVINLALLAGCGTCRCARLPPPPLPRPCADKCLVHHTVVVVFAVCNISLVELHALTLRRTAFLCSDPVHQPNGRCSYVWVCIMYTYLQIYTYIYIIYRGARTC